MRGGMVGQQWTEPEDWMEKKDTGDYAEVDTKNMSSYYTGGPNPQPTSDGPTPYATTTLLARPQDCPLRHSPHSNVILLSFYNLLYVYKNLYFLFLLKIFINIFFIFDFLGARAAS